MKKRNYFIKTTGLKVVLMLLLFSSANLFAQISTGGQPYSSLADLNSDYATVTLPAVDTKTALEEDAAISDYTGIPYRYGLVINTQLDLNNSGTWETLPDGSRLWRLGIKSEDAKSLNLFFDNFYMPKGAFTYIYDLGKRNVIGAFTEINNSVDGHFATDLTPGFITVIEYYEPVYSRDKGRVSISKVIHAYKDITGINSQLGGLPCNINIMCPIGAPWVEQKRSVGRMTYNNGTGSFLCTGSLINNTLGDKTPYFLTAEHCASDNWNSLVVRLNYESPVCTPNVNAPFQSMSGATNKAANFDTDFRLLQFNDAVPSSANAYFNGWDITGTQPQNETAIHHPGGDIKKISVDEQQANSVTGFGGRLVNGFWQVTWDMGMTEGGSSGCPLYDQNHRVIAQNLGGIPANCDNPQSVQKVFGKISESWAHGGSASNQLKNWLDPNNSGVTTLDGIDDLQGVAPIANFGASVQILPIGGGPVDFIDFSTNNPTSWSWSFPGGTPSTSTEQNPTGITYTATGPYTVTLTATNSFGSNMKTVVNYIGVQGVTLNTYSLISPPTNSTVMVSPMDPSLFQFVWGESNPSNTVKYSMLIKKAGPSPEQSFQSDNSGIDTMISLRKSFLDSLAVSFGLTGDSVTCVWRVAAFNGLDTLFSSPAIIKIRTMPVGISLISSVVPDNFSLYDNYPNPFNPTTKIKFDVAKNQLVKLVVYDMLGKEVSTLINENLTPGSYVVDFDARSLSSGMYFYHIETSDFAQTKRMVLVK